jgi:hypothetical protein
MSDYAVCAWAAVDRSGAGLVNGAPDILNVALDAGYGSHEAFTRAFREQARISSSECRSTERPQSGHKHQADLILLAMRSAFPLTVVGRILSPYERYSTSRCR